MATRSPIRTLLFGLPAVLIAVLGVFVYGAVVAHFAGAELGSLAMPTVAGGLALIMAMAMPLLLAGQVVQRIGAARLHVTAVRGAALVVWNGALIGALVALAPATTASVLRSSADWLPGTGVTPIPTVAGWTADVLAPEVHRGPAPEGPPPGDAQAFPESTPPPEPPPAPVLSAAELFAQRADAVVVVKTRANVDSEGILGELYALMGQTVREGHGSGFVVGDTLIVTNQHVVAGADAVVVRTRDGRDLGPVSALVIDAEHDLALLSVPHLELPALPLADPTPVLPVGADTYAIGAPLGLSYSLTRGIVSAHRQIQGTDFLQMQTTVAPGSSGGPLLDDRGRVVAVNTATRSPGLNLAVQVRHVHALLDAPRSPVAYAVWEPSLEVRALSVEGASLRPTEREGVASVLQMVARTAMGCVETVPPAANVRLSVPLTFGQDALVSGNLDDIAIACIQAGTPMAAAALQLTAAQLQTSGPLTVSAELVRGTDTLDLTVTLGAPHHEEAPADATPADATPGTAAPPAGHSSAP